MPREAELPSYLVDIFQSIDRSQGDLHRNLLLLMMERSGIMPLLIRRNPELPSLLYQFLSQRGSILLVGGEPGMGKSLLASDVRRLHHDLQMLQLPILKSTLCVITWDRTHQAFFEEISTEIGGTIPLPKGETHPQARRLISKVLADQIMYVRKYFSDDVLILVEAPFIDERGESIFEELQMFKNDMATIIMHSPQSRDETLTQGRLMHTSGQRDSMNSIRYKFIEQNLGKAVLGYSSEAQNALIREWWVNKLNNWQGMVVEWDPNDDRPQVEDTVQYFKDNWLRPDVLSPKALSRFTRGQLEAVIRAQPDIDAFIKTIAS